MDRIALSIHTVELIERRFNFRYRSATHFIEVFRTYYGPVHQAFVHLDEAVVPIWTET
ncbi:hypothetical protein [Devosia naphthalenivorans]|uniref:hypothetical protein n=1 Tax=Devosia naphthalenivorans TaxID=2082392 RepID=UPI0013B05233|nr:hypothetical protein [Devosia naphthalenivorans]